MARLALIAAVALVACGDDGGLVERDAGWSPDPDAACTVCETTRWLCRDGEAVRWCWERVAFACEPWEDCRVWCVSECVEGSGVE